MSNYQTQKFFIFLFSFPGKFTPRTRFHGKLTMRDFRFTMTEDLPHDCGTEGDAFDCNRESSEPLQDGEPA